MSNIQSWGDALNASFQSVWLGVANFIPNFLFAVVLFLVGWLVAVLLGKLVNQIIKAIKLDVALTSAGFNTIVERAGFALNSGAFLGALVKWFFIIVTLVATLDILGLKTVTQYLGVNVISYLPKVIVAVFVLLVSVVIAEALQKFIVSSAKAAEISSANVLGLVSKWAVIIFAVIFALGQIMGENILAAILQPVFMGIVFAVSLAIGLSFGLGGQHAASRYIEKIKEEISAK